ncbi:hypothetical protein KDW_05130 [Dictyobacter vulcani]|uniref:Glycosyl transferase family 1 domain-containing protein n=1 Tax=Dictyobacter vulcani TaxID=2607529 RepID=A0A5J4KJM1_9CHLR|nr:D-glucuronyl C5-epimerase family protein [Dictyobacter vulcani]GER86351.1 hypothetical protein KDW_05130 [Dictyobacter vulcani]
MDRHISEKRSKTSLKEAKSASLLSVYPIDMSSVISSWKFHLDHAGVPSQVPHIGYHPTVIAQYALAQWNQYLASKSQDHLNAFLTQARWLIEYEVRIVNGAGGWPISSTQIPNRYVKGPWLSALTQGLGLSVLMRAYQVTQEEPFREVAYRVALTFQHDILDGGVSTPIGEKGIFFEEMAVYPASHNLNGFIFALFGLYDYSTIHSNDQVNELIQCALSTMQLLLDEFDCGFWTRTDLLYRQLSLPDQFALQVLLLEALAGYVGNKRCLEVAARWKSYQQRFGTRLRYQITSYCRFIIHKLLKRIRANLFHQSESPSGLRVCVPITAFPVTGGMRTVLTRVAEVTTDVWKMEYLTPEVGPHAEKFIIHKFRNTGTSPFRFPTVWFYSLAGLRKLVSLMWHDAGYDVIFPQDGIFTAAFAGLAAKLAGVRVICIDHGNLVSSLSSIYHDERIHALASKHWLRQLIERFLLFGYWPSLSFLAWLAARFIDHFYVPGVTGDGVEDICRHFGIGPSRLTRFVNAVEINHHVLLDAVSKAELRKKLGIPAHAIVITTICRLAPEKGIHIALESIRIALSKLSPKLSEQICFLIVGEGPSRKQIEEDICRLGLNQTCVLWGQASHEEVLLLHSLSDIYVYSGVRGGGYSLVMLEAMASGCAVVASDDPLANVRMLEDGRGIVVPVGDVEQTAMALVQLVSDAECRSQMGHLARDYVARYNTTSLFKRVWMRATYWSSLAELLSPGKESERL